MSALTGGLTETVDTKMALESATGKHIKAREKNMRTMVGIQ